MRTAVVLAGFLAIGLVAPPRASAVTVEEIVRLSKSGVSDAVVLAMIARDRTIFSLDGDQVGALLGEGVSEAVVLAMLASGRETSPSVAVVTVPPAESSSPPVVVVGHAPMRPGAADADLPVLVVPGAPVFVLPYFPHVSRERRPWRPGDRERERPAPAEQPSRGIFFRGDQPRGIFFTGPQPGSLFIPAPGGAPSTPR